jgi:hypothetical protein
MNWNVFYEEFAGDSGHGSIRERALAGIVWVVMAIVLLSVLVFVAEAILVGPLSGGHVGPR